MGLLLAGFMTMWAQLPNDKFGKPSDMEWDFQAWGEAPDAEAVVLYKSMEVTYQLASSFSSYSSAYQELSTSTVPNIGTNGLDFGGTSVTYVCKLRTKILKDEGARYANIGLVYYSDKEHELTQTDEIASLKVRVYSKNAKGKVEKVNVKTDSKAVERIDDNYVMQLVRVPNVKAGDIIEYQYEVTSNRVSFLYDWSFQEEIPVLYSKCDLDIPGALAFNINAPIHPLIKRKVERGTVRLESHTADMKAAKTYPTNHYIVTGENILPKSLDLQRKDPEVDAARVSSTTGQVANISGVLNSRTIPAPAPMPKGVSHLQIGVK